MSNTISQSNNRMRDGIPRLSIGLPVYNGENYIKEALDSILAQTFEDFEVIISDNASTDRTGEICREYAARDPRVKYYRNDVNKGASPNFNQVFALSSGQYFKWAAHDDLLAPDFFVRCVEVLDSDPSVILCYSKIIKIDENGNHVGTYDHDNSMKLDSFMCHERFWNLMDEKHWAIAVFGVIRSEILRSTPLIASYVGSDRCLLAELGLLGRIHRVPEYLFLRREHPESSCTKIGLHDRLGWFDSSKTGRMTFPLWRHGVEFFKSVYRVPLCPSERFFCYSGVCKWYWRNRKSLVTDAQLALRCLLLRSKWGTKLLAIRRKILGHAVQNGNQIV
jgi:glycosyltransferase involved in cell wall biosynthesis